MTETTPATATDADPDFDPDFLERSFKITTVEVLASVAGIAGGMARDRREFSDLLLRRYLARYSEWLASLSEEDCLDLLVLLAERLEADEAAENAQAG